MYTLTCYTTPRYFYFIKDNLKVNRLSTNGTKNIFHTYREMITFYFQFTYNNY